MSCILLSDLLCCFYLLGPEVAAFEKFKLDYSIASASVLS